MKRSLFLGALLLAIPTTFSVCRAAQPPEAADFIIYNAKVLTVNSNFTIAGAIAVRDGRILAVGKERKVDEYRGPETRMLDAQGHTVMPGLYDAEVSSFVAATSELKDKWPVINSIADAQEYIRKQATNLAPGKWIVLDFIPPTRLKEGRLPTKEELDAATTNRAVCWNFGPVDVVNSKALEISKIDKDTQAPAGGEILLDPRHHKPTGLLRNASVLLKLPPAERPPTLAQERAALRHLYQLYNEQGITSIGEAATSPAAIDLFRDMSSSNELTVRINCGRYFQPSADADESIDRLDAMTNAVGNKLPYGPTGVGDDWVRIGPLQTTLDGNAGMGTAYLRTPYGIGPTFMNSELAYRGIMMQKAVVLPQVYLAAAQSGWQLEAHCAGDAALDFLLNSYEEVQFKLDIHERRFLIAHPEFQAAQDWSRCEKLGLGAIVEPTSLYEDGTVLAKTLGTNRLTHYMPFEGWFSRGIVAGGASGHFLGLDSLNTPRAWNPWLGMWITLTRETKQGDQINPQDKLTREEAVRFYTCNNAWLYSEDKVKGSLEPGKLADLIMVDTDILKCPVDEIRNTKVLLTVVDGKVVWEPTQPVFPGPQVIPAVTINVPSQPVNVAIPAPLVPAVAKSPSAEAAVKHAAEATSGFNPYAPVADAAPAPVVVAPVAPAPVAPVTPVAPVATAATAAAAPSPVVTSSNAAPSVATTVPAPAAASNATAPTTETAPAAPATPAAPVAQSSEPKPAAPASDSSFTSIAGAAPAEVAINQSPAATPTVVTNLAPTASVTNETPAAVTNQAPNAITTNAANSVPVPDQTTAAVTASPAPAAPLSPVQDTTATTPAPAPATVEAPSSSTPASADTTAAATPATPATPADAPAATPSTGPTQVATATTEASPATGTTTSAPASNTVTNDASGSQDWSRVGSGAK